MQEKTQGSELGFLFVFHVLHLRGIQVKPRGKSDHFANVNIFDRYEQKDFPPSGNHV